MTLSIHTRRSQPWRFMPGDKVYVRGWSQDQTVTVLRQLETSYPSPPYFPHYVVADFLGRDWRISQLELSGRPIPNR